METEVKSKSELETLARKLSDENVNLRTLTNTLCSTLGSVLDYNGIPASSAGRTLSSNLKTIMEDFNTATTNINSYVSELIAFDVNDFPEENIEDLETLDDIELPDIIPSGTLNSEVNNSSLIEQINNTSQTVVSEGTTNTENKEPDDERDKNGEDERGNEEKDVVEEQIKPQTKPNSNPVQQSQPKPQTNTEQNTNVSIIKTEGIISENGLTQRSSKEDIKVTIGQNTDISVYENNALSGFEVTTGNFAYELNNKDVELLYAIIAAEGDKSYDDSLALMSALLNRCEDKNWIASYGKDPIAQITALDQFKTYQTGNYMLYLGGNVSETVKRAVNDALKGVRNHGYLNFSKNIDFSTYMITETGNRYK